MRRLIAIFGIMMVASTGCRHTCGKCDCGAQPGEATLYAPMQGYPTTPAVIPPAESIAAPKSLGK